MLFKCSNFCFSCWAWCCPVAVYAVKLWSFILRWPTGIFKALIDHITAFSMFHVIHFWVVFFFFSLLCCAGFSLSTLLSCGGKFWYVLHISVKHWLILWQHLQCSMLFISEVCCWACCCPVVVYAVKLWSFIMGWPTGICEALILTLGMFHFIHFWVVFFFHCCVVLMVKVLYICCLGVKLSAEVS